MGWNVLFFVRFVLFCKNDITMKLYGCLKNSSQPLDCKCKWRTKRRRRLAWQVWRNYTDCSESNKTSCVWCSNQQTSDKLTSILFTFTNKVTDRWSYICCCCYNKDVAQTGWKWRWNSLMPSIIMIFSWRRIWKKKKKEKSIFFFYKNMITIVKKKLKCSPDQQRQ